MNDFERNENRALFLGAFACLAIAILAGFFSVLSSSQAIILDGLFNLCYFFAGLVTLIVVRKVRLEPSEEYPVGYASLEPFLNGAKGLLILGVSLAAMVDALIAIMEGGRPIAAGDAFFYGVAASVIGWSMVVVLSRAKASTQSPLVGADAANWLVNSMISSAVAVAFLLSFLLEGSIIDPFLQYLDPGLVVILVLVSLGIPVRMIRTAYFQLINRARINRPAKSLKA